MPNPLLISSPVPAPSAATGSRSRSQGALGLRLALLIAALAWTAVASPLLAQAGPTGFQDYLVLGRTQHVWDMMTKVVNGEGGGPLAAGMNSVVTAATTSANQRVYYDHWEDGFEADILNPVQLSTLIIGDGNPANGDDCDFNSDPCGTDVLNRGEFINFRSDAGLGAGCTVPSAQPATYTNLCSSVPVADGTPGNARCVIQGACTNDEFRFDGGDRVVTSGIPLSLVHNQFPLTQFIGGATELLPLQAVRNALSYSIPVGEDLYPAFGCPNCVMEPFHYVDLNVVAFQDNTNVLVQSPGSGAVSFVLNEGEHWSSLGFIDETSTPANAIIINAGTKISTDKPVAGLLFTGGDGTWATRHYALLPDLLHATDYITTAPGDDPAVGPPPSTPNRPLNLYIFNPDPLNPITVTTTDSVGSSNVVVPANSVVDYFSGTGRFVPAGSTVRLTSSSNFWGISAYDYNTNISDWGHSWLATKFLSDEYRVSFAPGNVNIPPNLNLDAIFAAATLDNTQVQADFDNNGTFDVADLNGDGCVDPGNTCFSAPLGGFPACVTPLAAPLCSADGPAANTYIVDALDALRFFDPGVGVDPCCDNTGTLIVANKPVALAWGQDTDLTTSGDTALDTGYTIYPSLDIDSVLVLDKTVDTPVVSAGGGVVTYTLTLSTGDFGPITSLQIYDLLPPGIIGADYVPGSTLVTYPDLMQDTSDPVASIDPMTGRDRLDWTLSPDSMAANRTLTVRYSINIPAGGPRLLTNEGRAEGSLGGSTFSPFDDAEVVQTDVTLTKAVDKATASIGETLTYTLQVSNNSLVAETNVTILDPIPPDTTFVPGSITDSGPFAGSGVYDGAQNAVVWTAANLPAMSGPHTLTFQVTVNVGTPFNTVIPNTGTYESTLTPLFPSNEVTTLVTGPDLAGSKSHLGNSPLHPNEVTTFEILVEHVGVGTATNVRITDPFPTNATYVPGSMRWRRNNQPFASVTDAADADPGTLFVDRVELLVASLGAGEDLTFRFDVQVDPGTAGLFVANQASFVSDQTFSKDTNLVQIPIVGDADVTGHVFLDVDGDGTQDPGEPDLANMDVLVTDSTGATQTVTTDANGDWLATVSQACYSDSFAAIAYDGSEGSLDWSGAGDEWIEFTDQGDADQDPTTPTMQVVVDPLATNGNSLVIEDGPGSTPTKGFTRQADLSGGAGFTAGFATLSFQFRREAFEAGDVVTLDIDYDNDGTFNDVLGTFPDPGGSDPTWQSASFVLDSGQLPDDPVVFRFITTSGFSSGTDNFYVDNVLLCNTQVTANVDESDPDFPAGAVLTTANDPQTVASVSGGTVATGDVGYQPLPIEFTKDSDPLNHQTYPGETITYTLVATNSSNTTQTGIDLSDPLPTGTSAAPGSTVVNVDNPVVRVTEYFLAPGTFTGTSFDLSLGQPLFADYFVIVQGSDGDGTTGGTRGPDENYVSLTQDPFGTGGLGTSAGNNILRLQRGNAVNSWVGVVTVVECLTDCGGNGFSLLDVQRVAHTGTATSGSATSGTAWSDINQVQLVGGFNGAGCDTAQTSEANTIVCHTRLFPSGTDQINWTRDAGGATLSTATSTVMVVEWGSDWTVQRVRVQGTNGGDGANAVGEYNTAAISSVTRANTWVWGTGHTADNGIGDAAEGVLITLGDGVNQNASETLVAAASEFNDAIDFEVWALTHASLAVDYEFKADGDIAAFTVDVPVTLAGLQRMALSYNGQNGTGTAYPRPMFSARYLDDTTVRLQRRRSNQPFPAWVQGIDFSGVRQTIVAAGNDPAGLVVPADGYTLAPGGVMTVTFQVVVDDPLAPAITQIDNTATLNTDQEGPLVASITDDVFRLGVTVEPNNGNFVVFDAVNPQTRIYSHEVVNTGEISDSYVITAFSELGFDNPLAGWMVELIDPNTGAVIATDTDFSDATWDMMMTINTGILLPGGKIAYDVRVTVPAGTPEGTEETTTLTATSDTLASVVAFATDETTVVDQASPVILASDQSGVVAAGGSIAYTHRIFNNTGATDTFDLTAFPTLSGWTATIYNDSNGDGVYTPGIDVAIMNTLQLPDGASQLLFVVVDAPGGASSGDTDVTHVSAVSRNDTSLFDGVTDTTTVLPASTHDLSGGDTLFVSAGDDCVLPNDCPIFPGTLKSLSSTSDRFDFTITASPFFGLDGLNHPTQLWIDTDADGVPDLQIAEDADGNGTWDTIAPGFDTNTDNNPDVLVAAGGELAYTLRRPVDPLQLAYRDPVTLTAISQATGERDSVTATNLLAAATHSMLSSFTVTSLGGQRVIEWQTSLELGTAGFRLHRSKAGESGFELLHAGLLQALRDAPVGGTYRFLDTAAVAGESYVYRLTEVDIAGKERILGWSEADADASTDRPGAARIAGTIAPLPASGFSAQARQPFLGRQPQSGELSAGPASIRASAPSSTEDARQIKLLVNEPGLQVVSAATLAGVFGESESRVAQNLEKGRYRLFRRSGAGASEEDDDDDSDRKEGRGGDIAWLAGEDGGALYFYTDVPDSIYTDQAVYWLERGKGTEMESSGRGWASALPDQHYRESVHFEEEGPYPLLSVIEDPDSDFWFWSFVNVNAGLGIAIDTMTVTFETPARVEGTEATMVVHLQAESSDDELDPDHRVEVLLNGVSLGTGSWDGATAFDLEVQFDQALLEDGENTLEIKAPADTGIQSEIFYLDSFDLQYVREYRAVGDRLEAPANGRPSLTFAGFSRSDLSVFDVSDPDRPVFLERSLIEPDDEGGFQASFRPASVGRHLVQPLALAAVAEVQLDEPSGLTGKWNRAAYLVIAAEGLESSAEALAEYRGSLGLTTMMVKLQDVYDEFSGGEVNPFAIRDFLAHALANWREPPRFLVLAGDSSFDYKDRLGFGGNLLPSPMVSTPEGLFPSDHRITDLYGDGVPEVAVGRLPVRTDQQLAAYLAKLQAYESGVAAWKSRTVWVADAPDEGGEFTADSEWLIEQVPSSLQVERVYVEQLGHGAARQQLLDSLDEGAQLVNFLGHSNLMQMGDDAGLLLSSDVPGLDNGQRPPVLAAMTCALGRFDRIVFDTLGEALVLSPDGGVVALWAPTGFSFNEDGVQLGDGFLPVALNGVPIGNAVMQGLLHYLTSSEEPRAFVPFVYTLLGDPVIRLQP